MSVAEAARPTVEEELSKSGRREPVEFRRAEFSFRQLSDWHRQLSAVHALVGVEVTDVAERHNRVRVGISNPSVEHSVMSTVTQLDIPPSAVMIVHDPGAQLAHTLNSRTRPFAGGTQIHGFYNWEGEDVREGCTYGINVLYSGARHMVVNSHCTQRGVGGLIGAEIYQNIAPTFTSEKATFLVGTEVQDPPFRNDIPGCSGNCRYSDAALVAIQSGDAWDHGAIAAPIERAIYPDTVGDPLMSSESSRLRLGGIITDVFVGDIIEKVGMTTGWTAGEVGSTCENRKVLHDGSEYIFVCTAGALAGMQEGDSGSPVFWQGAGGTLYLAGMAFAGSAGGGHQMFFNHWSWIDYELGSPAADLDAIPDGSSEEPPPDCVPEPPALECPA